MSRKTKMNGCGASYCRYNIRGRCECDFIILGETGVCLLNTPDAEKITIQQNLEAKIAEITEAPATDAPRLIGFREE